MVGVKITEIFDEVFANRTLLYAEYDLHSMNEIDGFLYDGIKEVQLNESNFE